MNTDMLTEMYIWSGVKVTMLGDQPVVTSGVMCRKSYPGHPKGCPNYGKRGCCPPATKPFTEIIDTNGMIFAVAARLNLAEYRMGMLQIHPTWTERQLKNPLYWQGSLRAKLERKCDQIINTLGQQFPPRGKWMVVPIPEAHGVNVFATMHSLGFELQRAPTDWVCKIALIGVKKG